MKSSIFSSLYSQTHLPPCHGSQHSLGQLCQHPQKLQTQASLVFVWMIFSTGNFLAEK